jgi:MFS family permease
LVDSIDKGVIAEVLPALQDDPRFMPTSSGQGAIVSLLTGGAFFGAFFAGYSGDIIGRRLTIVIATIVFVLGAALQSGAQNNAFLMGGRFVTGMGIGLYCMIVPYPLPATWVNVVCINQKLLILIYAGH